MTRVPDDPFNMESYVQTTLAGEAMSVRAATKEITAFCKGRVPSARSVG